MLEPDPNEQLADLLRAILFALDSSALQGENPGVPPVQEDIYWIPVLIFSAVPVYASLLISTFVAFFAVLSKGWLGHYLLNEGESMTERCGGRQRRCDRFEKSLFTHITNGLPRLLQIALALLGQGILFYMSFTNPFLGFSVGMGIASPFFFSLLIIDTGFPGRRPPSQLVSTTLHGLHGLRWIGWFTLLVTINPILCVGVPLWWLASYTLRHLWSILCGVLHILHVLLWLPLVGKHHRFRGPPLPTTQAPPQESTLTQILPLSNIRADSHITAVTSPLLTPTALATLQEMNATDIRCVSWILRKIPNPEVFDIAIPHAGTIRWFGDSLKVRPPFDLITSNLKECFGPTGKMHPRMRDRAYYSLRAIVWIHIRAMCVSEEFAHGFSLPIFHYDTTSLDPDLKDLLGILGRLGTCDIIPQLYFAVPGLTPAYLQWTSDALLHLSWIKQRDCHAFNTIGDHRDRAPQNTFPPGAILNRLLASCIFLGHPIKEEVLIIQDKLYVISYFFHSSCSYC